MCKYGENGSYKFSYRDDFGHRVTKQFKPNGETWDDVLPFVKEFLQGIGFQFDVEDELVMVNANGVDKTLVHQQELNALLNENHIDYDDSLVDALNSIPEEGL